jgi:hypothetical protein
MKLLSRLGPWSIGLLLLLAGCAGRFVPAAELATQAPVEEPARLEAPFPCAPHPVLSMTGRRSGAPPDDMQMLSREQFEVRAPAPAACRGLT